MKTLLRVRRRGALRACVPNIWIWTSKIMPDLWLSAAVFCQINNNKKSLHPTVDTTELVLPQQLIMARTG